MVSFKQMFLMILEFNFKQIFKLEIIRLSMSYLPLFKLKSLINCIMYHSTDRIHTKLDLHTHTQKKPI